MSKKANNHRIAIFLPDLNHGGEQRILVNSANEFSKRGMIVDFLLVKGKGPLQQLLSKGVNVFAFETRNTLSMINLIRYLRRYRPKTLLSSLEFTNVIALIAAKLSRVKCKTVVRVAVAVSMHRQRKWARALERVALHFLYPWADEVITVSNGVKADLLKYAKLRDNRRITTIYNPVGSHEIFDQSREPATHKWFDPAQNTPVVLGVGRLTKQKDFPTLIKAIAITNQRKPVRLIILGDGDERDELMRLIQGLDLGEIVDLPGFVKNPFPYFRQSNAFVLSSRWEGLPSVLIEAMVLRVPIISTDCPVGVDEILDHGNYGKLVPVGDYAKMADAIIETLDGINMHEAPESWIAQFSMAAFSLQLFRLLDLGES